MRSQMLYFFCASKNNNNSLDYWEKKSHLIRQAENMNLNLSRHLVRMYWNGAIERPKQKNMKSQAFLIKTNQFFVVVNKKNPSVQLKMERSGIRIRC